MAKRGARKKTKKAAKKRQAEPAATEEERQAAAHDAEAAEALLEAYPEGTPGHDATKKAIGQLRRAAGDAPGPGRPPTDPAEKARQQIQEAERALRCAQSTAVVGVVGLNMICQGLDKTYADDIDVYRQVVAETKGEQPPEISFALNADEQVQARDAIAQVLVVEGWAGSERIAAWLGLAACVVQIGNDRYAAIRQIRQAAAEARQSKGAAESGDTTAGQ
jgi:hypothetical protein